MELLKKIIVFVVFFIALSQAMGNLNLRFEEKFAIENHQNEQPDPENENISLEIDDLQDQYSVNDYMFCICASTLEESIHYNRCNFQTSFIISFWQPPQIAIVNFT
jgi:hypothetical protein